MSPRPSALRLQLMERCGSLRPADRPSISDISASLRLIVKRAERAEAGQPKEDQPSRAALDRRCRVVVQEEEQLSEEMDVEMEGSESRAESVADGASPGSDHETESGKFNGDGHTDQMEDEEGRHPCPKCSDRLRSQ